MTITQSELDNRTANLQCCAANVASNLVDLIKAGDLSKDCYTLKFFALMNMIKAVEDYSLTLGGTYIDWYLPSLDELMMIYTNLHLVGIGGFSNVIYWTSTEVTNNTAQIIHFAIGLNAPNNKTITYKVRAIRDFTDNDTYTIGQDTGYGYVFYIDGNKKYVAAKVDMEPTVNPIWGCMGTLLGATGSIIGTGKNNTSVILTGCIATPIAASLCAAYSVSDEEEVVTNLCLTEDEACAMLQKASILCSECCS